MNPNERRPLILGHLFAVLAVLGIVGIFVTSASPVAVCVFVLGLVGVIGSTAALVLAESAAHRAAPR